MFRCLKYLEWYRVDQNSTVLFQDGGLSTFDYYCCILSLLFDKLLSQIKLFDQATMQQIFDTHHIFILWRRGGPKIRFWTFPALFPIIAQNDTAK